MEHKFHGIFWLGQQDYPFRNFVSPSNFPLEQPKKNMFTVPFLSNLFICYYWLKSDDVNPCADTNLSLS